MTITNWKRLFRKKPNYPKDAKHTISYAFTEGGVDFYQFEDIFSLPYLRGLTALQYYTEFDMRCDRSYLKAHTKKMDEIMSDSSGINIGQIALLNMQLKERMDWIIEPDLMYKLASVVFFRKQENPYIYEQAAADANMKLWKASKEAHDFFLQKPLTDLIPYLKDVDIDFPLYSEAVNQINLKHRSNVFTQNSKKEQTQTKESYS